MKSLVLTSADKIIIRLKRLNQRTAFLRWVGTMDGHKIESLEIIMDNDKV